MEMIKVSGEFKDNLFNLDSEEDAISVYNAIQNGEDFILRSKDSSKVFISNSLKSKLDLGDIEIQGRKK